MAKVPLTIATWDYDRVRPLMDGRVQVEGCEVNYLALAPEELTVGVERNLRLGDWLAVFVLKVGRDAY